MNHEELEQVVLTQGNTLRMLDDVIRAAKLGTPKVLAFRCSHSGRFYPADYIKEWGRLYGIGQGPEPVSECWDSQYWARLPRMEDIRHADQLAYPVTSSCAQVDLASVFEEEFNESLLIPAHLDTEGTARAGIVLANQLRNDPHLRAMHEHFRIQRRA